MKHSSDALPYFLTGVVLMLTLVTVYRDAVWNPRVRQMNAGVRPYERGWWLPWKR